MIDISNKFKLVDNQKNYQMLTKWLKGGHFPHAVLIDGEKGTGKQTFAKEAAKALLCVGNDPPCNNCQHCIKNQKNIHPDVLIYKGEGGSKSFHINEIRDAKNKAFVVNNEAEYKVIIFLNAHEMTIQAQNAILQIIEQPPKNVFFILTCDNKNNLLPTIQSRVVSLTMNVPDIKLGTEIIKKIIPGLSNQQYDFAIDLSLGNVGKAIEVLENKDILNEYKNAEKALKCIANKEKTKTLGLLSKYEKNKDGLIRFLGILKAMILKNIASLQNEDDILTKVRILEIIKMAENALMTNISVALLITKISKDIINIL